MSTKTEVAVELAGGKRLVFETGRMAKQASGAVLVSMGETVVLATAVASPDQREGIDFFPLTVDYREYTYSGGRIPGGFIKREGRPSEKEILTARQIDVLGLMMQGKSNKIICRTLGLAEQTVRNHVSAILRSLKAGNRTEAVVKARALGLQSPFIDDELVP